MGVGNRSQGKMYWRKAVEYKLANKHKSDVIDFCLEISYKDFKAPKA